MTLTKGEIIIYRASENTDFQLPVRVENDTVWLNRNQMAILFDRDVKTIGKHISNALKEELQSVSVIANFATTALDGKIYQVEHFNLDMIISVGYRVKSNRGVQFRIWASGILKKYLLNGYVSNHRIANLENEVVELKNKINEIDFKINTQLPPNEGIFYDGQIFDAYSFVSDIIKSAKTSIILIDNYIDQSVLLLISKRKSNIATTIYTSKINEQLKLDIQRYNEQYEPIKITKFNKSHDRFLIIDHKTVFHFGASLKDLGKKWFAFSKMNLEANDILQKLIDY